MFAASVRVWYTGVYYIYGGVPYCSPVLEKFPGSKQ